MKSKDIPKIAELFKQKYNRELIGTGMGQFHSDFASGVISKDISQNKDLFSQDELKSEIYATNSIFLGKKCYIDQLGHKCSNKVDYHIWMKGVPNKSIYAKCVELNITPLELYKRLANGEEFEFDLCVDENNETQTWLKRYKLFGYKTITQFKRCIKF